ncbi:phosphodiester glycosidase family protein [Cyanobium sp. WAJ14-Wanaka]|uniref:phosphodiester glycosidase family protein n=1 Tax=Cyanobium sp. WAJ14-Wanaka TaxID=2823725 RepID=UPI0020CCB34F|nr:phosphodiester glycosidase family protein [Cyanobium sp. WAJ14-Wanaka]
MAPLLLAWAPQAGAMPWGSPPPPPPPLETPAPARGTAEGRRLVIQGRQQEARWLWIGSSSSEPEALWIPLEVLEGQLGVVRRRSEGSVELEWFGQTLLAGAGEQRSLDDEVAVDALPLFRAVGLATTRRGGVLELRLPPSQLLQVRSSKSGVWRRVVLDLTGPVVAGRSDGTWLVDLDSSGQQRDQLGALGLVASQNDNQLQLRPGRAEGARLFSLGDPYRLVLEFSQAGDATAGGTAGSAGGSAPRSLDPRLQRLLGQQISWDRLERRGIRLNAVRVDPRTAPIQLRLLTNPSGMEGLSSVQALANTQRAIVAINGGYFNRVKRLPLGALKSDGQWLSGPILNRGVAAWQAGSLPRFGRLSLEEAVSGADGQRLPVAALNSGYVQRGISRYGPEWGPSYRALSGGESALVLSRGVVERRYGSRDLEFGVPLRRGEILLVGRGGVELPWLEGTAIKLTSRASNDLGQAPFVMGGGPLLLLDGRIVLNGGAETFSSGFLNQGAPRTVIGSDGKQLWLITLEGTQDSGPSLGETARVLQELGLRDALNLDGGSSTGLVMGGTMPVKGRGVVGAVHNGLGLVPSAGSSQ